MIEVVCNLCGADDWRQRFPATMNGAHLDVGAFRCTSLNYGHHPQIVECLVCGFVYANPRWPEEDLLRAYTAVEDDIYRDEREGRELTFVKHLQALENWTGPAEGRSLLDVGANIGIFVEAAAAAGWEAMGVEPSSWSVAEARRRGVRVIQGTQDAPELQELYFDVLTMWDVIEHVDDPNGELKKSFRLLKPGGWLAVHTMDIESLAARLMGRRWPWLMDMHLHYFSHASLAHMLEQNGFNVVWTGAQGRYLRLGYLAGRVSGLNRFLGRALSGVVKGLHLTDLAVPVNFGDLFTVYARRPE